MSIKWEFKRCAVIVAHPDDETLWAGGLMLTHPQSDWEVVTLCRKSDTDRAPKFFRALTQYNAKGAMGDLDDGPEQEPLDIELISQTIPELIGNECYDLIITHAAGGEYTRHLRHEEVSKAVLKTVKTGRLSTRLLWTFSYEDGNRQYLPRAVKESDLYIKLPNKIWQTKYNIITEIYGFNKESFEARTTPKAEAFRYMDITID